MVDLKSRRGALEYIYLALKFLRDTPVHVTKKKVYFEMQTSPNRIYRTLDWLEEKGLVKCYRKGKHGQIPKITAEGMNWLNMMEPLMEMIDYEKFRTEFTSWAYQ